MKEIPFEFLGLELTLYYRCIPFSARDFHVEEEVTIKTDVGSFTGIVTSIASFGVTIKLARYA